MVSKLVIRRLENVATGAALQRITLDAYPYDVNVEWRHIMARVVGDKVDLIEIGLKSGRSDYPLESQKTTINSQAVSWSGNIPGSGDYQIYAEFDDAAAGKMLELTAFGLLVNDE